MYTNGASFFDTVLVGFLPFLPFAVSHPGEASIYPRRL